jgi:TolB-like protein
MRRSIFNVFLILVFLLSSFSISDAYEKEIKALSSALAESIVTSGKRSIAVVDFTDLQGNVTELGRFLAEEFSASLSESGKGFEVVDRTHLKSLLKEHQLSLTGLIDPKTARKLGEIAGVQGLITGTLTPFGDSIRLAVKVLDTSTAKVIGASRGDIAKTKAIEELLARGIESPQLLSSQPTTPTYTPPVGSTQSRKVGNITVTVKRIMVARGQVMLDLDFYNHADNELTMGINQRTRPDLTDEKGNTFRYENQGSKNWVTDVFIITDNFLTLNPKSHNDVRLKFLPQDQNLTIKNMGSNFSISFIFLVYNRNEKSSSTHNVSFADIKAQVPK